MTFGRDVEREGVEADLLETLISASYDSDKVPILEIKSWGGRDDKDQALINRIIEDWREKDFVRKVQDNRERDCLQVTDTSEANEHVAELKDGSWPY